MSAIGPNPFSSCIRREVESQCVVPLVEVIVDNRRYHLINRIDIGRQIGPFVASPRLHQRWHEGDLETRRVTNPSAIGDDDLGVGQPRQAYDIADIALGLRAATKRRGRYPAR